jgi:quercetin dioxygenase-like cupin family protein
MTEPQIIHHFADHLYAKETHIPAGQTLIKHKHNFTHLSILASGKVIVANAGENHIIEAPACIEIKESMYHGVKALTDVVWYCIHATDETDPAKVDEVLIKGD